MAPTGRTATSSRRAGRVTNKTRLIIYRGSDKLDDAAAETIVWEGDGSGAAGSAAASGEQKHHHVGAKGVDSGEFLEHHLQAALSSASLLHSRSQHAESSAAGAAAAAAGRKDGQALNYHIPTPDATGLIENAEFAKLYQTHRYVEPNAFIRFSDTVEESSGGWGGLGYCMDDEDVEWLSGFNSREKAPAAGNGEDGSGPEPATVKIEPSTASSGPGVSPKREKENIPLSSGSRERRNKAKDRDKGGGGGGGGGPTGGDKEGNGVAASSTNGKHEAVSHISEDVFEFVMGVMEKYTEDTVPTLHTNLSLLPTFSAVEHLFSSPVATSFLPNYEQPRGIPDSKTLVRIAKHIYPHWKSRREVRKGRTIIPILNYDETNDGDPYVCFRRRDIRATRKTRRTDNHSVEQFQKLQFELRKAHQLSQLALRREVEKKALYKVDREVYEAKWKLYETKRRWPSLGLSRDEEEIITGRPGASSQAAGSATAAASAFGSSGLGTSSSGPLGAQSGNVPSRKKQQEREREEREKRDRAQMRADDPRGEKEKTGREGMVRYFAPEEIKARLAARQQQLDEELARKKELDSAWDDATDMSFQPLPLPASSQAFRPYCALDPIWSRRNMSNMDDSEDSEDETAGLLVRDPAVRLRRGRGGLIRVDRRAPFYATRRGPRPTSPEAMEAWLFPDESERHAPLPRRRPRSIDEVEETMQAGSTDEDEPMMPPKSALTQSKGTGNGHKRQRLDNSLRYDASRGGGLGVGMGLTADDDRIIIDDTEDKYIKYRTTLLDIEDFAKLRPDTAWLQESLTALDQPIVHPPAPIFVQPQPTVNPAMMQAAQMEHLQRYQLLAHQQALAQQQAAAVVQAQQQLQQQQQQQQQMQQQQQQHQAQQAQPQAQAVVTSANTNGKPQPQIQQQQQQQQVGQPAAVAMAQRQGQAADASANGGTPNVQNAMLPPASVPRPNVVKRVSTQSAINGSPAQAASGLPVGGGNMPPPAVPRTSMSPNNAMQAQLQLNGQSPQMPNGMLFPLQPQQQQQLLMQQIQQQQQQQQQQQAQQQGANKAFPMMVPNGQPINPMVYAQAMMQNLQQNGQQQPLDPAIAQQQSRLLMRNFQQQQQQQHQQPMQGLTPAQLQLLLQQQMQQAMANGGQPIDMRSALSMLQQQQQQGVQAQPQGMNVPGMGVNGMQTGLVNGMMQNGTNVNFDLNAMAAAAAAANNNGNANAAATLNGSNVANGAPAMQGTPVAPNGITPAQMASLRQAAQSRGYDSVEAFLQASTSAKRLGRQGSVTPLVQAQQLNGSPQQPVQGLPNNSSPQLLQQTLQGQIPIPMGQQQMQTPLQMPMQLANGSPQFTPQQLALFQQHQLRTANSQSPQQQLQPMQVSPQQQLNLAQQQPQPQQLRSGPSPRLQNGALAPGSGTPTGNTGVAPQPAAPPFNSPSLPTGDLQLKLPAHATQRLALQNQPPVSRA